MRNMTDWIFQGNPQRYDLHIAVAGSRRQWWSTPRYRDRTAAGDRVWLQIVGRTRPGAPRRRRGALGTGRPPARGRRRCVMLTGITYPAAPRLDLRGSARPAQGGAAPSVPPTL